MRKPALTNAENRLPFLMTVTKASTSSLHFAVFMAASCFLEIFSSDRSLTRSHISVAFW